MKVLHALEALGTGVALHVEILADAQQRSGDEVVVAAPRLRAWGVTDSRVPARLRQKSIDVREIPFHSLPTHPRNARAARMLSRTIQGFRPDVVHSHSTTAGAIARPVARRLGVPTVHTPNGVRFADTRVGAAWTAALVLERLLAPLTDWVIAVSPSEADVLKRAYAQDKIAIVPNGIEVTAESPPPFPDPARIVSVHRLVYQKDPALGVRVMSMVRRERPGVEAVIVGDGPLAQRVSALIRRVDPGIRLMRSGVEGREAIASSSIILQTSRWEGGPYVPLEAMALGRPVVATAVVGSRDVVVDGRTGYLFEASQPEIACRRLVELIDAPDSVLRMGIEGQQRVADCFSPERMIEGVRDVYRAVG